MSDPNDERLPLVAYELTPDAPEIRPAPSQRAWMDATHDRFAYRCLPMVIANMNGWEILCQADFTAVWTGHHGKDGVEILWSGAPQHWVASHFGAGVMTFHIGYLFRTPPGVNLWVRGPANQVYYGIQPLEGVVETDWSVAPFTMNWRFQRPWVEVEFRKGDPICTIVPVPRGFAERFEPEVRPLKSNAELNDAYRAWSGGRGQFLVELKDSASNEAKEAGWQRDYFQGRRPDGQRFEHHQTRLNLRPFSEAVSPENLQEKGGVDDGSRR